LKVKEYPFDGRCSNHANSFNGSDDEMIHVNRRVISSSDTQRLKKFRQKSIGQILSKKNPGSPTSNYLCSFTSFAMNTASPAPTMTKENSLENCLSKPDFASSNQEVVNVFLNYKKQQDDKKFA
jgi:hypothetical protein